jgi:hypothetical protein
MKAGLHGEDSFCACKLLITKDIILLLSIGMRLALNNTKFRGGMDCSMQLLHRTISTSSGAIEGICFLKGQYYG